MKRYVVQSEIGEGLGWLSVASNDDLNMALEDMLDRERQSYTVERPLLIPHRVIDQFRDNLVLA